MQSARSKRRYGGHGRANSAAPLQRQVSFRDVAVDLVGERRESEMRLARLGRESEIRALGRESEFRLASVGRALPHRTSEGGGDGGGRGSGRGGDVQGARQGGGREEVQERGATRESHVRPRHSRQHRRLEVERGEEDWSGEGVCLVLPYQGSLKRVGIHEHTRTRVGDVASSSGKPLPLLSLSLYMYPLSGKSLHMRLYVSVYVPALRQVSSICICRHTASSICMCRHTAIYICVGILL